MKTLLNIFKKKESYAAFRKRTAKWAGHCYNCEADIYHHEDPKRSKEDIICVYCNINKLRETKELKIEADKATKIAREVIKNINDERTKKLVNLEPGPLLKAMEERWQKAKTDPLAHEKYRDLRQLVIKLENQHI